MGRLKKFLIGWSVMVIATGACSRATERSETFPELPEWLPKLTTKPQYFGSCQEIKDWAATRQAQYRRTMEAYYRWQNVGSGPVSALSGADMRAGINHAPVSNAGTNIQVAGVDEPDIVKLSDKYLFTARSQSVEIVDRANWKQIQSLPFPEASDLKLLAAGGKLAVLSRLDHNRSFAIDFLEFKNGRFVQLFRRTLPGTLADARMAGHNILLVANSKKAEIDESDFNQGDFVGVPCESVQMPILDDFNFHVTSVHRINIKSPAEILSTSKIGGVDKIYVTNEHLYTLAKGYNWFNFDPRFTDDQLAQGQIVAKFNWQEDCGPRYVASGMVHGQIRNAWAFHERPQDHRIFIATTYISEGYRQNRLWALEQNHNQLESVGSSPEFGRREDIRAVRYLDNKAYVVTFEKTDPLFVIDLAEPNPKLLSELKVPGFSTYLHPAGPDLLLGVGYGATADNGFSWLQGVQVSLFDKSNPKSVVAKEQKEFGGRMSHADVSDDHHAFSFDSETGIAAIPVRLLAQGAGAPWTYVPTIQFSGALLINTQKSLEPVAQISHWEWLPEACRTFQSTGQWWELAKPSADIRRVVKAGTNLVSVSPFGVKVHDRTFAQVAALSFSEPDKECAQISRYRLW